MKTRMLWFVLSLLTLSVILQGCPGTMSPPKNRCAYIYAPEDSVYVRSYDYDYKEGTYLKREEITTMDMYGGVYWYVPSHSEEEYIDEYHDLHVRRLNGHGDCYVLIGKGVNINGVYHSYHEWRMDANVEVPYSIENVIDSLRKYYPNYIIPVTGLEEQSIYSEVEMNDTSIPSIVM